MCVYDLPILHIAEHSLKLGAVAGLAATAQQLGERVHRVVAVGAQRSDHASAGGVFAVGWPRAHRLHPHLLTGIGHLPLCHPCSVRHGHFVVFVAWVSVEQDLTCKYLLLGQVGGSVVCLTPGRWGGGLLGGGGGRICGVGG